jgi:uncharacterized paraquat-inducible protein A
MDAPSFVNLSEAHLCTQCEAIGDSANHCPRCQSDALISLTRMIPRHQDSIRLICAPVMEMQLEELACAVP